MSDYVTFTLGGRAYATRIDDVREVVRLAELMTLPDMTPPLSGVLDLRGVSLPVIDIRPVSGGPGDVLVLDGSDGQFGFACDAVTAVMSRDDLTVEESRAAESLPDYVECVLRGPDGPVFCVDVRRMAGDPALAA